MTEVSRVLGSRQRMNAQTWRFDNANALYYALIDSIAEATHTVIREGRDPVLGLPTGNTMVPLYRLAAEKEQELETHRWVCFNIDEYYPITTDLKPYSFREYMDRNFYSRLNLPVSRREFLNGEASDPNLECEKYEQKIKDMGGFDLLILGLGTNGHIGFNEPGSELNSRTRLVELHPQTLMANFKGRAPFHQAMTLGLETILEAKKIFVIAHGKNKARAVKESLQEIPTRMVPATALQKHKDVTWFLDQEASSLL